MKYLIPLILYLTSAISSDASNLRFDGKNPVKVKGVLIQNTAKTTQGYDVLENPTAYYGRGYILGTATRAAYKGLMWRTWEVDITQGNFLNAPQYLGALEHLSIDDPKIYQEFESLTKVNEQRIFEYREINPFNWELEDSHFQITKIYKIEDFLKQKGIREISAEIVAKNTRTGSNGEGSKVGRIVDVERYGKFGDYCSFELNIGGLQEGGEALAKFAIVDEEICAYVEKVFALGIDVEIFYGDDFWEGWQPSDLFCNRVKCLPAKGALRNLSSETSQPTDALYQDFKRRLLNDPDFINKIMGKK